MKKFSPGLLFSLLLSVSILLSSCEAIAGIFKAGMWVALIGIVLVVAIVFWIIRKIRK